MIEILSILLSSSLFKWTAICIFVIYFIHRYIASKCNYWESQGVSTDSVSLYTRLTVPIQEWEQQLARKNGKIFGLYEFTNPILYVSDPELIRDVLVKDFHLFPNRRDFTTGSDPIIDNMLSVIKDDKWKRVRSIMSPTFSSGKLRKMRPLIEDCLNTLVTNLDTFSKSDNECEMKRLFGAFSMEVILQVAFGTKVDVLFDENNPIIVNARKMFNRNVSPKIFLLFFVPKLAKLLKISIFDMSVTQFFKDFTLKVIQNRRKTKDQEKRIDFLQLMLDAIENNSDILNDDENDKNIDDKYAEQKDFIPNNKSLTNDEFVAQCVLFLLAGYDTTATTLSYVIYNLSLNPEAQERLYEEAKSILSSNEEVDYDVVYSLKYLDAVVMESLRLYPPAVFLERVAKEDHVLGNTGIKIKKDHIIHFPIYSIQRDPENFADPELFKPERFLPENRTHHPYSHLPFGAGPRNCVGMRLALLEAKLALIHSVYRFKFSTTKNTSHPPKCYLAGGLLAPKEVLIKVEKRSNF